MRAALFLMSVIPCISPAQTAVEYGLSVARASAAVPTGKSLGAVFAGLNDKLSKVTDKAATQVVTQVVTVGSGSASEHVAVSPCAGDPPPVQTGTAEAALIEKCGKPAARVATGRGDEKLWFKGTNGDLVVSLAEGKVTAFERERKETAAVVVLK